MISSLCGITQSSGLHNQPQPVNKDAWAGMWSVFSLEKKSLVVDPRIKTMCSSTTCLTKSEQGNTQFFKASYPDRS